jgi:CRP/FNR family transcriptional regulator, cyclic AMP receptor protein
MNASLLPTELFFLRDVSEQGLAELAAMIVPRRYPKGNVLFYHGEAVEAVYILLAGRVNISLIRDDGREVIVATIRDGGIFGTIAALDGGTQIGNALTAADSTIARVSRDRFLAWMRAHPSSQESFAVEFARMLRAAYSKIGQQSLLPVRKRLLGALVQIARSEGQAGDGDLVTFIRPTHQELAQLVGSSRVVVSRLLKEILETHGIGSSGRMVRLPLERVEAAMEAEFGA